MYATSLVAENTILCLMNSPVEMLFNLTEAR